MRYTYEDLDDTQFERVVVQCAKKLFGSGVQSFSRGPDGGRDARFRGVAERFPSSASPWRGTTVFQAKHTNAINVHFSDPGFSGLTQSSTISKEMGRVKKLVLAGQVDNYMLFANRRLGGRSAPDIELRISEETGLKQDQVHLAGEEYMNELLLEYPNIPILAQIDPIDGPMLTSSADIAEVILAVARELGSVETEEDAEVVDRVTYAEKNLLNQMSPEFATLLSDRYMQYTRQISNFLANPGNQDVRRRYTAAVDEFQFKIIAHRRDYQTFDRVFNHLVDLLANRDSVLRRELPLLRAVLFYMYWHCDIGLSARADS